MLTTITSSCWPATLGALHARIGPRFARGADQGAPPTPRILTIALCATLSGADEWVAMATYGSAKREWFGTFLTLPNSIPSHDTFGRVFAALDPDQFQTHCFTWTQSAIALTDVT